MDRDFVAYLEGQHVPLKVPTRPRSTPEQIEQAIARAKAPKAPKQPLKAAFVPVDPDRLDRVTERIDRIAKRQTQRSVLRAEADEKRRTAKAYKEAARRAAAGIAVSEMRRVRQAVAEAREAEDAVIDSMIEEIVEQRTG